MQAARKILRVGPSNSMGSHVPKPLQDLTSAHATYLSVGKIHVVRPGFCRLAQGQTMDELDFLLAFIFSLWMSRCIIFPRYVVLRDIFPRASPPPPTRAFLTSRHRRQRRRQRRSGRDAP
jgi:hypothetical protein